MKTRHGRVEAASRPAALFHVVLRGYRTETLVRDEEDRRKMTESIESMLFWCGGRVFGCRCEADRVELLLEPALVPLGGMFRYVTVPYALHFNRVRGQSGQVFRSLRVYRLQRAFLTEFILWLHRPLAGAGWTADAAYLEPRRIPWVDVTPVLEELGRGPGARQQYRALRARGVDEELAAVFDSSRDTFSHAHSAVRPALMMRRSRQRTLVRSVVDYVARHEDIKAADLKGRTRVRRVCRARCLVTLVAVRCGVTLRTIASLLDRDGSTLEESVLRLRAHDPQGLVRAAEEILAVVSAGDGSQADENTQKPEAAADGKSGAQEGTGPSPVGCAESPPDEE